MLGEREPCLSCGVSCCHADRDADGMGACPGCGASFHGAQWTPLMEVPLSTALRGSWRALAAATGVLALALAAYAVVLVLSIEVSALKSLVRAWGALAPDMQLAVDLALIVAALALAVRTYRRRQAALFDRQHVCCRICNHDLRGAPVDRGTGRCPECGAPFARFP